MVGLIVCIFVFGIDEYVYWIGGIGIDCYYDYVVCFGGFDCGFYVGGVGWVDE